MATSTPIPESILANVGTVLALITVANSFRNTVATVSRQFLNPETTKGTKLPALMVFGEEIGYTVNGVGATPKQLGVLRFKIQGIDTAYSNPSTAILELVQDVREKLFTDRSRGGYADNTVVSRVEFGGEPFGGEYGRPPFVKKPYVGFMMDVEVMFQEVL